MDSILYLYRGSIGDLLISEWLISKTGEASRGVLDNLTVYYRIPNNQEAAIKKYIKDNNKLIKINKNI